MDEEAVTVVTNLERKLTLKEEKADQTEAHLAFMLRETGKPGVLSHRTSWCAHECSRLLGPALHQCNQTLKCRS